MVKRTILCTFLLFAVHGIATADIITENFDSIASLPGAGWVLINNSSPAGTTGWFQGNAGVFSAQAGADNSYVAANFLNAAAGGNISNWLITPIYTLHDGDKLSFFTRSAASYADRLELRMSLSGVSTDVGTTDTSVGKFNTLLLTVNPTLDASGYPDGWTEFTVTLGGIGPAVNGRFGFRYSVTDTNTNGDYIGIDTMTFDWVPEPTTFVSLGTVLAVLGLAYRTRLRRQL